MPSFLLLSIPNGALAQFIRKYPFLQNFGTLQNPVEFCRKIRILQNSAEFCRIAAQKCTGGSQPTFQYPGYFEWVSFFVFQINPCCGGSYHHAAIRSAETTKHTLIFCRNSTDIFWILQNSAEFCRILQNSIQFCRFSCSKWVGGSQLTF